MPLPNLICSPLNLVPKAGSKGKYRLIHNLTFLYDHNSINANIPDDEAKVEYLKFNNVIHLGLKHGVTAHTGKVDFDTAFRNFPVLFQHLLVLRFTLDVKYFINSSMAFGTCSSCKIFEEFAGAVQWALENETKSKDFSHYLDDFIMIHAIKSVCACYMATMQDICHFIGAPLSKKKTEGPTQKITFLGMLIDFFNQIITIPKEKVDKAIEMITEAISTLGKTGSAKGKVSVRDIQKITGTLNFFCHAIPCGRPFLRRLYDLQSKAIPSKYRGKTGIKPNPNFLVRINEGTRCDLALWLHFLNDREFYHHRQIPFLRFISTEQGPLLFADASGNSCLGFGCYYPENGERSYGRWPVGLFRENGREKIPSIALLELLAIVMAVEIWAPELQERNPVAFRQ